MSLRERTRARIELAVLAVAWLVMVLVALGMVTYFARYYR